MEGRRFDSIWNALYPDSRVCASSMELKSILLNEITGLLNNKGWNLQEAASSMGMPRGIINNILEGNVDKITIDDLLLIMEKAGRPVEIMLRGQHRKDGQAGNYFFER